MSSKNPVPENGATPRNKWWVILSVGLGIAGGLVLMATRFGYLKSGDLTIYSGLGLMLGALAAGWLSSLPRDKAVEWIKSALFALLLALSIRWAIAEPYRIPSSSMETTLHGDPHFLKGDRVFVNKWIYGLRWPFLNKRIWNGHAPERWDIVVFKSVEPNAEHPTLVKRIVGMPGERIEIRDGKIFANGERVPFTDALPENTYYTSDEFRSMSYGVRSEPEYSQIPEGHYLVLGDNSAYSRDGRYFGWLPNEHIVGRVASIWWPPPRWRDFTGFSDTLWWNGLLTLLAILLFVRLFIGQSWPVMMDETRQVRHIFVSFASLGLRLPFVGMWLFQWATPQREALVLYRSRDERVPSDALLFGRIAALPGEHVEIVDGVLMVNSKPLALACFPEGTTYEHADPQAPFGRKKKQLDVPEGHYFILGDPPGEANALDSRLLGWVPQRDVLGVAVAVWWPLTALRKL